MSMTLRGGVRSEGQPALTFCVTTNQEAREC